MPIQETKTNKYVFDCGCSVDIVYKDGLPKLNINYQDMLYDLNYKPGCEHVWEMLEEGKTKGVFQLESNLGKTWSEKLKPDSIDELAALSALIRPSCLSSFMDDKNMTQHYVDRKHKIEPAHPLDPALETLLKDTYQIIIFQEQALAVVSSLAGFTEEAADVLRKAMGTKDAELMAKVRKQFIEGCEAVGKVDKNAAVKIFDWIQESQRYSFNKAHATSYGQVGYLTAWTKYHFPMEFFCSWISMAREKLDAVEETRSLIDEAKKFDINVLAPSLQTIFENDCDVCIDKKKLRFGLRSMKFFGDSTIKKTVEVVLKYEEQLKKKIDQFTWTEMLYNVLPNIKTDAAEALITGGVLDSYYISRSKMLLQYQKIKQLTKKQLEKLIEYNLDLSDGLLELVKVVNVTQKQKISDLHSLLNNSTHSMADRVSWIITTERNIYGVPITYNAIDVIRNGNLGDTTCKEFLDGKQGPYVICGEIQASKSFKIKNGKNAGKTMAKCCLTDGSATIDCVLFQKNYDDYADMMDDGNLVCIYGKRSDSNSLIIDSIEEIY